MSAFLEAGSALGLWASVASRVVHAYSVGLLKSLGCTVMTGFWGGGIFTG